MTTKSITYDNTLKGVRAAYKALLDKEAAMKLESGNDKYYSIQDELKADMVAFLRMNFIYLNTLQLLTLCGMVQRHRPVNPHSFLITCENLIS